MTGSLSQPLRSPLPAPENGTEEDRLWLTLARGITLPGRNQHGRKSSNRDGQKSRRKGRGRPRPYRRGHADPDQGVGEARSKALLKTCTVRPKTRRPVLPISYARPSRSGLYGGRDRPRLAVGQDASADLAPTHGNKLRWNALRATGRSFARASASWQATGSGTNSLGCSFWSKSRCPDEQFRVPAFPNLDAAQKRCQLFHRRRGVDPRRCDSVLYRDFLAPVLLIVIAIAGLVYGQEAAQGATSELGDLMGRQTAELLQTAVASLKASHQAYWPRQSAS